MTNYFSVINFSALVLFADHKKAVGLPKDM